MPLQRRTAPVPQPQRPTAGGSAAAAAPDAPVGGVEKPLAFAVHRLQQRFRHPAMEAAFQRWQAENVFYKVSDVCGCSFLRLGPCVFNAPYLQQHG